MSSKLSRTVAVLAALSLAAGTVACSGDGADDTGNGAAGNGDDTITPTTGVATPTESIEPDFETREVAPIVSEKTDGTGVDDPGMKVTYHWQGTSYAPNGGTVATVAVKNNDTVPMPPEVLGQPTLKYSPGASSNDVTVDSKSAEEAGIDKVGLDLPLGAGATTNVHYAFDVSSGNLWDAEFTIGNVTFSGNLNN
ncbi:hypothetical protein [Corynebacterium cystitidis]|uniref:hypothetical protein n=1 Tax=Corynebacterium cystitidis TaxID=35757 RepID=UPI00211E3951|nr:hypothetical protein [Corynebacterium cystitidis]